MQLDNSTINYYTDDPTEAYQKAIRSAKNKQELVRVIVPFKVFAGDALKCARKFTDNDFNDFVKDLKRAKKETDEEWNMQFVKRFGDISMPIKLVVSSLMASQYCVPWGTSFIRCEEMKWEMLKK